MNYSYFTNKKYFFNNEKIRFMFNDEFRKPLMHSHEFWEISYVYEGSGWHNTETESVPISRGGIVLTSPNAVYGMGSSPLKSEPIMRDCVCLFQSEYFNEIFEEVKKIREFSSSQLVIDMKEGNKICLFINDDGGVYELLWRAAYEYNRNVEGSAAIVKQLMCSVLINIIRIHTTKSNYSKVESIDKGIEILIKYLKNNMSSRITLNELVQLLHFTPEYVCRYFKQHMGMNLYTYLTELRMQRAKQLLSDSAYSVSEIALHCGYRYLSNFQKAFKQHTGMTPSEYRKLK
ncbi:MAG: AraC family transcriptional regulator [Eubacterium sp.]